MKIMKNKILYMAMMMALAFTACSEEDIMQSANGEAGTLRITSVSIEGQEAGRSRVAYEGSTTQEYLYNRSITGLSDGDKLTLNYTFSTSTAKKPAYAIMNGSEWALTSDAEGNTPVTINPIKNGGGIWNNVYMDASFGGGEIKGSDEGYSTIATSLDIVQGNSSVIPTEQIKLLADALYADTNTDGGITINKDLNSPTLGTTTIALKHNRALLRVSSSSISIDNNSSYIVNGSVCQVSDLATLWAVVEDNEETFYYPFTNVSIESTDYLQVIVPVGSLTGFKAVLYVTEAGNTSTVTIDLPFKVDNAVSTNLTLAPNTQYPLTLNISPASAEVNFTIPNGKPGWGTTEEELSNAENEKDLEYIATSKTFIVKTAAGLQHLNEWMTGTKSTSEFKAKGFAGNQYITVEAGSADALAMNITFMADITLDAPATTDGSNWTPIGTYTNRYTGTIDGNGKTLGGMVINATENCQGFVRYLGTNGKIKNLTFANAQVVTSNNNAGIVAGYNCGIVENCHTISTSSVKGKSWVGGIVGYNWDGTITNCTNAAQVVATNDISQVGGITGENRNVVSFCINSGSVSGSKRVGGIVGYQNYVGEEVIVIACGNTGSVSGSKRVGGIVGWNSESNAIASWTITTAEMDEQGATTGTNDGVGQNFNGNIPACYSVADAADLDSKVSNMNIELWFYYGTNDTNNKYYWAPPGTNDGCPTLTTEEPELGPM